MFTDPYTGPVELFDGIWCITNVDGKAMLQKNVSIAAGASSFNVIALDDITIPLNEHSLASISLPVAITAPESPIETFTITGCDPTVPVLQTTKINPGTILPLPSEISTGINDVNCVDETQIDPDACYDIFGNRVDAASAHGIIISGGHKYYKR